MAGWGVPKGRVVIQNFSANGDALPGLERASNHRIGEESHPVFLVSFGAFINPNVSIGLGS